MITSTAGRGRLAVALFAAFTPLALLSQTARPTDASSSETAEPPVKLPVFQVNDSSDVGYQAGNTISATRLNTPIYKVPFTINVATEEFLRDINVTDFQGAVRFMAAVDRNYNPVSYGQFYSRGVAMATRGQFLDSRPILNGVGDTFSIDRVEVLKGPASPIAGIATPVGMINFITKQAQPGRTFGNLAFKYGSHDYMRSTLDLNLPYKLGGMDSALRVMLVHQDSGTDVQFEGETHKGVTIANTTKIGSKLTLSMSAQLLSLNRIHVGQFAEASSNAPGARGYSSGGWDPTMLDSGGRTIPASPTAAGNPGFTSGMYVKDIYDLRTLAAFAGPDNGQFFTEVNLQKTLAFQATENLAFELYNSAGRENKEDPRTLGTTALAYSGVTVTNGVPVFDPAGGRYFEIQTASAFHYPPLWRFYHRFSGAYTWNTSFMQQIFRAGMDYQWQTGRLQQTKRIRRPGTTTDVAINTYVDQAVNAANNGFQRFFNAGGQWVTIANAKLPDEAETGLFATAQGSYWKDRIHTVFGYRHDVYFYKSWQSYNIPVGRLPTDDPLVPLDNIQQRSDSPIYSASFEPVKGINLYYTRAYSFSIAAVGSPILNFKGTINDNPTTAAANGLFDPNNPRGPLPPSPTAVGDEVGVKFLLLDNRVSATFATYKTDLKNIRVTWPAAFVQQLFGPNNPNTSISWTAGGVEQEAKGWEAGLQANPTRDLTLAADFSYSSIVFKTNPITPAAIGQQQTGYYKKMGNLLARYSFPKGALKGLYLGSAVQYRGSMFANVAPNVKNPDNTIWNPFVGYQWRANNRVSADLRVDVTNATDEFYLSSSIVGPGRAAYVTLTLGFK